MITRTAGRLSLPTLVWLLIPVFVLHDGEEVLTAASWVTEHQGLLAGTPFAGYINITTPQMAAAVFVIFLLVLAAAYLGLRALRRGELSLWFGAMLGILFLHSFTHLGQSILTGGYTPGVLTVPILLLYSLYLYGRLFQAGLLNRRLLGRTLLLGATVAVPMVLGAHAIGRLIFPTGV